MAPHRRICRQSPQYLPSAYFQAVPYTGNATASSAIATPGLSDLPPDLVWAKNRDQNDEWKALDTARGATKELNLDANNIESTDANGLTAFSGTDGFTLGTGAGGYNDNAEDFIAYLWKEGALPGFDIALYTGTGSAGTFAHNLGVVPEVMMQKHRTKNGGSYHVYHHKLTSSPETKYLRLDQPDANSDLNTIWDDTLPTSSVFTLGTQTDTNFLDEPGVMWLWAGVPGFSKFGDYIGNNNADGPMIHCGFRPAFVLIKNVATSNRDWMLFDSARDTYNAVGTYIRPDTTDTDSTSGSFTLDFTANGFKVRGANSFFNESGKSHVFMAFAEAPFKYANAR